MTTDWAAANVKMRRRIERDYSWDAGTSGWQETNEVHFIYDGNVVVEERNANNVPLVSYTRGTDLSGTLQGAGGIGGLLARTTYGQELPGAPTTAFYHADGNGNITALMYPSQQLAAKYLYDPFGNMLAMSGPLMNLNKYRFSSKEWNDNLGLYNYGYRFYEPSLQRWLNRDPSGEQGFEVLRGLRSVPAQTLLGLHFRRNESSLYTYVLNGPVDGYDPLGLAERGPGTIACQQAEEQAQAAWDLYDSEPSDENFQSAFNLSLAAAYWCSPPPPKPPWWKNACRCIRTGAEAVGGACIDAAGALGGLWLLPGQDPSNPYHEA